MKVLVVDDIGYSRRSVAMILQRRGHQVLEAKSGNEALAELKSDQSIDLVITDLIMGDIDGVDLYIKAKRLERMNDDGSVDVPPFILLTSAQPGRPGTNRTMTNRLTMANQIGVPEDPLQTCRSTGAAGDPGQSPNRHPETHNRRA